MTVLTRWNPYRDLNSLQHRMNRLFDAQFGGREESLTAGAFVPPVDVYEDEHSVQLKLEVAGVAEKDLDIKVENNTLTVSGERKFEKEEKEENFHRVERRYGSFTRSFTLPTTVNTEDIKADYEQGVLKIRLAKRQEAKPKQIKVNIGTAKPVEGQKAEAKAQVA
ncbi:MAG TPA: Hsp20/alpha crystallin family protein [Verrucomicrobiae bacterium]|jgi:HSP20 family protein|nr:Hsp20/alpha crystallin family protein [Verrucomicrobiae bacterium]